MANHNHNQGWPLRWPKYLPFAKPIGRSRRPVPNVNSVDWPQAQWAPMYLPPGSASFQPYSYLKNDEPLKAAQPVYTAFVPKALGPLSQNLYRGGPGGDRAALPRGYGGVMNTFNLSKARRRVARLNQFKAAAYRARLNPVHRMGVIPTNIPIPAGVPKANPMHVPPARLTAGLGGLALTNQGEFVEKGPVGRAQDWWAGLTQTQKLLVAGAAAAVGWQLFLR